MKDAHATWALVVGIDTYDHVPNLTGAAADAAASVQWLCKLGVPREQILLHAAPCAAAKPQLGDLGIPYADCTEPVIWTSFKTLRDQKGARLFVILCGHGFFEPNGARVYLTREFESGDPKNLGIDWYAAYMRGMRFARQFFVMDGCLNLPYTESQRSTFKAGEPSSVVLPAPRADVQQVFCYAASQGERAMEVDGHGLFTHALLRALDPDEPHPGCVDIDETTGARLLDLNRAVRDVVAPGVTARAGDDGRTQRPGIQPFGAVALPAVVPVVELPMLGTARVRVTVDPATAVPDIKRLALWSDDNAWRRELPRPPATTVSVPHDSRLPVGLPVAAWCSVKDGLKWEQPALQLFSVTGDDRDVVFHLQPPGGRPDEIVVHTVDTSGAVVSAMSDRAYGRVEQILADFGGGFELEEHETGPVVHMMGASGVHVDDLALAIASAVNAATPADVAAVVSGVPLGRTPSVHIPLTRAHARRLAGVLTHEPLVEVGSETVSLDQLAHDPVVAVDNGPLTVRVRLPWGVWTFRTVVGGSRPAVVRLPERVGAPPLRVQLLRADPVGVDAPPRTVATTARQPLLGSVVDATGKKLGALRRVVESQRLDWVTPLSSAQITTGQPQRWGCYAVVSNRNGRLAFPLSEHGAVALHRGRTLRAEPLSKTPSPHWDRLVAAGRLKKLTVDEAEALTFDKWDAPLLGLAGAYACNAHHLDSFLDGVLTNLRRLDPGLPDLPILRAALAWRRDEPRRPVAEQLAALGASGRVPLFRWGVALGLFVARHYEETGLERRLHALEARIVPSSVWTLWRP